MFRFFSNVNTNILWKSTKILKSLVYTSGREHDKMEASIANKVYPVLLHVLSATLSTHLHHTYVQSET